MPETPETSEEVPLNVENGNNEDEIAEEISPEHKEEDLTSKDNPLTNSAIEELKSKLITKEKEIEEENPPAMIPESQKKSSHLPSPHIDEGGLILPRKPNNPVRENADRQNLHKELIFNQKIGKNVLNQKSELQRVLESRKDNMAKKELEQNIASKTPELEKIIAERAKRLEENDNQQNEKDKSLNNEFLQARMKLKKSECK